MLENISLDQEFVIDVNGNFMKTFDDIVVQPGFYAMTYDCSNCGHSFMQQFPKGTRASQGECPRGGIRPINKTRYDLEDTL